MERVESVSQQEPLVPKGPSEALGSHHSSQVGIPHLRALSIIKLRWGVRYGVLNRIRYFCGCSDLYWRMTRLGLHEGGTSRFPHAPVVHPKTL